MKPETKNGMIIRKFAAIDIGSNAVRLLFMNVIEDGKKTYYHKSSIIRVPVRLGDDVFVNQVISEEMANSLIDAMKGFWHLIKVYDVINMRACGTSAMREAQNSAEIVERIKQETGIEVEVITGKQEAEIIFENQIFNIIDDKKTWMWIDVGGGSTEFTIFQKRKKIESASFKVGTVRFLKKKVSRDELDGLKNWLKIMVQRFPEMELIGSGGNINRIFKISEIKIGKPLSFYHLMEIFDRLKSYSYEDRVKILGLNLDRADVIVYAAQLFLDFMRLTSAKRIHIPKVGLSDGIVLQLYKDYKSGKTIPFNFQ